MVFMKKKVENPVVALERTLGELTARCAQLEEKLSMAAGELARALDDRRQALLDADLSDLEASTRRDTVMRAVQDRHASLIDALSQLGAKIAEQEAKVIAARDVSEREQLAATLITEADALAAAAATFADAGRKVVPLMRGLAGKLAGMALDFAPRITSLVSELPLALNQLVGEARGVANRTASGQEPIIRRPPPPPVLEVAPPVERAQIYCLSPLRWFEGHQVMTAPRYSLSLAATRRRSRAFLISRWPESLLVRRSS
jgi:hypothetical protein